MSTLVVFTHPCSESFAGAVCQRAIRALGSTGADVVVIDLYQDAYLPGQNMPLHHLSAVEQATTIMLIYPTWWSSLPAILLDWMQRAAQCDLSAVTHVASVATHGGHRLGSAVTGQSGRHTVGRVLLSRCSGDARFSWLPLYGLDKRSAASRSVLLDTIERRIGNLARQNDARSMWASLVQFRRGEEDVMMDGR